jgi:hypothetical protein
MTTRAKHFDQSGIKLIAKIAKEMDLPRESASVRNDGEDETIAVAGFALRNGKKCYYRKN